MTGSSTCWPEPCSVQPGPMGCAPWPGRSSPAGSESRPVHCQAGYFVRQIVSEPCLPRTEPGFEPCPLPWTEPGSEPCLSRTEPGIRIGSELCLPRTEPGVRIGSEPETVTPSDHLPESEPPPGVQSDPQTAPEAEEGAVSLRGVVQIPGL